MVEENLLERRSRSGTFIRVGQPAKAPVRNILLICPAVDTSLSRSFLQIAERQVRERGWSPGIIRYRPGEELEAARRIAGGASAILLADADGLPPVLVDALRRATERAVVTGHRFDHLEIPKRYRSSVPRTALCFPSSRQP